MVRVQTRITQRAGGLLHALLAGIAVGGVALAVDGDLSVGRLVTLFLVTSTFVGQVDQLARHLPDLQAGLGAVIRLRQMLDAEPEPVGGLPVPDRPLDVEVRHLHFAYGEGADASRCATSTSHVPAGHTIALVGRTGSGKSTLASLVSRAVDPEPGSLFIGGVDVLDLDLQQLRAAVGVVTQRTEILAGTLADNIALFTEVPRERVLGAVTELGLDSWVAGLPDGVDTLLGPGGTTLSAGEEQLVAFARLLVRDVQVVVLDEATARMDPLTESLVVQASDRLLRGRTGVLVAHRLSTTARAELVAVLEAGRVVQTGLRSALATRPGPFQQLLAASHGDHLGDGSEPDDDDLDEGAATPAGAVGGARRVGDPPPLPEVGTGPSLARGITHALLVRPWWGAFAAFLFLVQALLGAFGAVTGFVWGTLVQDLQQGRGDAPSTWWLSAALVVCIMSAPSC